MDREPIAVRIRTHLKEYHSPHGHQFITHTSSSTPYLTIKLFPRTTDLDPFSLPTTLLIRLPSFFPPAGENRLQVMHQQQMPTMV